MYVCKHRYKYQYKYKYVYTNVIYIYIYTHNSFVCIRKNVYVYVSMSAYMHTLQVVQISDSSYDGNQGSRTQVKDLIAWPQCEYHTHL